MCSCFFYPLPNSKYVLLVPKNNKVLFRQIILLNLNFNNCIKSTNNSSKLEKYGPKLSGRLRNAHPVEFLLTERLGTFLSSVPNCQD